MIKHNTKTGKTSFILDVPDALYVSVLGDFNGWNEDAHPMTRSRDGLWKSEVKLDPGEYQFRYRIDHARWANDETAPTVRNEFGSENSLVVVKAPAVKTKRPSSARTKKKA
jgi:1,4-alpha-glucan branching enzyme